MSYQRKYIAPELLRPNALRDRRAALVFLDRVKGEGSQPPPDHHFIPIRSVRVVDATSALPSNRVELTVELLSLIVPNDLSESSIRSLSQRPVPYRTGALPGKHYYFVLEDDPVLAQPNALLSEPDTWEKLAGLVKSSQTLSDAVIISLSHLRNYGEGRDCTLRVKGSGVVYALRPNTIYELVLRVFDLAALTSLSIRSSSDLIAVTQAFPTTIGGLGTYRVILSCKRTLESSLAGIFVDVGDVASDGSLRSVGAKLLNAKPVYLANVSPAAPLLVAFIFVVFFGFLFSSLSKEFFDESPRFALGMASENVALVAKVAGAVLLAVAAWLGFRKLPSGGSGG